MSLLRRYRDGQVDFLLSVLQIGAFLSAVALVIDAALLYRHFTEDALTPILAYLWSLKLAFPPALVLGASYLYAFLTGEQVSEAPKSMWRQLKNSTLQSKRYLTGIAVSALAVSLLTAGMLHFLTPPAYEKLITQLLGSANDDGEVIKDAITKLKASSPAFADRLSAVAKVFDERRLWNNENKAPSVSLPRIFIRQLDAGEEDMEWRSHPLRLMAMAEAHSMLAQALAQLNSQSPSAKAAIASTRDEALKMYQKVIADTSNRTTELMKRSARQNIGNVYLYAGDCHKADKVYAALPSSQLTAGIAANRVAALISCGELVEAVEVGKSAIIALQGKPETLKTIRDYVALLTNTGFGELIGARYLEGLEDMQAAHDLIPDQMAKQNLALAQIAMSRQRDAIVALEGDSDAPTVSPESQLPIVVRNGGGSCSYLIRALALATLGDPEPFIHANVQAYARNPQPGDLIVKQSASWKAAARSALASDQRPCRNLALLPFVAAALK